MGKIPVTGTGYATCIIYWLVAVRWNLWMTLVEPFGSMEPWLKNTGLHCLRGIVCFPHRESA